jgi:hypothetical protein
LVATKSEGFVITNAVWAEFLRRLGAAITSATRDAR